MCNNVENWSNLYLEFEKRINDSFEMFVLSEYEEGGSFILISPLFDNMLDEDRDRMLNEIINDLFNDNSDLWLGNTLTPKELMYLSQQYEITSSLLSFSLAKIS